MRYSLAVQIDFESHARRNLTVLGPLFLLSYVLCEWLRLDWWIHGYIATVRDSLAGKWTKPKHSNSNESVPKTGDYRLLDVSEDQSPGDYGLLNDNEKAGEDKSLSRAKDCLWKLGFWVGFGLLGLLGVVRTSLLITRKTTYGLDWSMCANTTVQEEPADSSDDEAYFRVADLLYVLHSLLHWPEYAFLAHGTYQLVQAVRKWDTASRRKIRKQMTAFLFQWKHSISATAIFLFIVASLVVPILSIADAHEQSKTYPNCSQQSAQLKIHYVYQFLSLLAHFVSPGIRIYMAVMVLAIKAIWFYEIEKEETGIRTSLDDANTTEDWKAASTKYYESIIDYEQRQSKIVSVLRVFQAWFVFQWFIYYFQFLVDLSQVIRPWVGSGSTFDIHHMRRMVYAFYDFLAFAIPHVSGVIMNQHHEAYLTRLRQEQLNDARNKKTGTIVRYSIASLLPIEKSEKCDFVPSIPASGISIPLDSPGYALGLFLTIFALTGTFITEI